MKLVVIVPAYNEGEIIGRTMAALTVLKEPFRAEGIELRLLVVDDGSADATGKIALEAGADRIVRHRHNQGLGAAVRSGLRAAREENAQIVVKFDADLQHDPADIREVIRPILEEEVDVVYGNRFDRISYPMPLIRKLGNRTFTTLMRWLTGWPLKDSQPGIFAINQNYLSQFYLPGNYNYTQQILMDAYRKGMHFTHVPVAFRERKTGHSFVSLKYPFKVLPQILLVLVSVRPLKIFAPIGLVFFSLGMLLALWEMGQWLWGLTDKPVIHVNAVLGLTLFGVQTLFFGILAHLIVERRDRDS